MSDLEVLQQQLAALTAQVAALTPTPPPLPAAPAPTPAPPRPVRLHTLVGGVGGYIDRSLRVVRQLAEAVALCLGAPSPSAEIPADWVPLMRTLAASRAAGSSWREALAEAGLEVPRDLSEQAQAVKAEVDQLWSDLLPLVGLTYENVNSVAKITLKSSLKRILS